MPERKHHNTRGDEPFRLRSGAWVRIRRMRPDDVERLEEFNRRVSPETLRLRFFTPVKAVSRVLLERLASLDFERRAAFVATDPGDESVRAVGRYEGEDADEAEIAFIVEDSLHGEGIATELLYHLAQHAREQGFSTFRAMVLRENQDMVGVFRKAGYPLRVTMDGPCDIVRLDISHPPARRIDEEPDENGGT